MWNCFQETMRNQPRRNVSQHWIIIMPIWWILWRLWMFLNQNSNPLNLSAFFSKDSQTLKRKKVRQHSQWGSLGNEYRFWLFPSDVSMAPLRWLDQRIWLCTLPLRLRGSRWRRPRRWWWVYDLSLVLHLVVLTRHGCAAVRNSPSPMNVSRASSPLCIWLKRRRSQCKEIDPSRTENRTEPKPNLKKKTNLKPKRCLQISKQFLYWKWSKLLK